MTNDNEVLLGRREFKKRETRRAIRSAALHLALQDGLERVTVEAIAQSAGISPRTFFNYFESKEDALVTQATEGARQVQRLLAQRTADESPLSALRHAILASDYFGSENKDHTALLARQRLTHENTQLLAHHLSKVVEVERIFATAVAEWMGVDPQHDMTPDMIAAIAVGAIRVAVRRWVAEDDQSLHTFVEMAFDHVEHLELQPAQAVQ